MHGLNVEGGFAPPFPTISGVNNAHTEITDNDGCTENLTPVLVAGWDLGKAEKEKNE